MVKEPRIFTAILSASDGLHVNVCTIDEEDIFEFTTRVRQQAGHRCDFVFRLEYDNETMFKFISKGESFFQARFYSAPSDWREMEHRGSFLKKKDAAKWLAEKLAWHTKNLSSALLAAEGLVPPKKCRVTRTLVDKVDPNDMEPGQVYSAIDKLESTIRWHRARYDGRAPKAKEDRLRALRVRARAWEKQDEVAQGAS